jgi:hypothetical protein
MRAPWIRIGSVIVDYAKLDDNFSLAFIIVFGILPQKVPHPLR